jgi:hypothetical protein
MELEKFPFSSSTEDWKRIRKHCMIWSLNRFASAKYVRENPFENFLHSRMIDPSRQLQLCCFQLRPAGAAIPSTHLSDGGISFEQLHTLSLLSCEHYLSISAPSLRTLKLANCRNISRLETMERLTVAFVIDCPENTLALFPLEQLERLHFKGKIPDLANSSSRLAKLKQLTVHSTTFGFGFGFGFGSSSSVPFLQPLKNLESLTTVNLDECDAAGLSKLTSLDICRGFGYTTVARETEIFPQLRDFHGRLTSTLDLEYFQRPDLSRKVNLSLLEQGGINEFVQEQPFLQELDLSCQITLFTTTLGISHYDRVKSLKVTLPTPISKKDTVIPLQFPPGFQIFTLSLHPTVTQFPVYSNLQQINVTNCFALQRINSLASIPYITITNCPKIEDFSCLGASQRFLVVTLCPSLKNSDLNNFGNISHLSISLCANIISIERTALVNNRYLHLRLENLQEIRLTGTSYVKVWILNCPQLSKLDITGRVHVLNLYDCDQIKPQQTLENCDHWDSSSNYLDVYG